MSDDTITVICPRCGIDQHLTGMTYRTRIRRGSSHYCPDCRDVMTHHRAKPLTDAQLQRLLADHQKERTQ